MTIALKPHPFLQGLEIPFVLPLIPEVRKETQVALRVINPLSSTAYRLQCSVLVMQPASSVSDAYDNRSLVLDRYNSLSFPPSLQASFHRVISINVEDPKEAQLFFLGDIHSDPLGPLFTSVIEEYGQEGDIVVVEGYPSLLELHANEDAISLWSPQAKQELFPSLYLALREKGVRFFGWDNEEALKSFLEVFKKDEELLSSLTSSIISRKERKELKKEVKTLEKQMDYLQMVRDETLKITITELLNAHPNRKIFVTGGMIHFTDFGRGMRGVKMKDIILSQFPEAKALLALPKEINDDPQKIEKYTQRVLSKL